MGNLYSFLIIYNNGTILGKKGSCLLVSYLANMLFIK